jgi:hypothetical protein
MATILIDDNPAADAPPPDGAVVAERPARTETQQDAFALLAEVPARGSGGLRVFQTVPSALAALRANKGRSVLTTLGIIIGVAAVIAIVALGEGASASVSNQLAGLGVNLLTITPGSVRTGGAAGGAGGAITLKSSDADAISQQIPGLSGVSPVVSGNAQVIAGNQNWSTRIQAVDPQYCGSTTGRSPRAAPSPTRTTPTRPVSPSSVRRW